LLVTLLNGAQKICSSKHTPLKEYMIQRRKPLRVNAKGTTNTRKTRAEVDSRASSTIPMEYKTDEI